jgi:uncharacterized membrane protein
MSHQKVEHERMKRRNKIRLKPDSFSDIIFGLALSIGSLILVQHQVLAWQSFVGNILLFGFSFAVIAMVWLAFSETMRYLSTEVPSVVLLNLMLFFCVVLEPYLFYTLENSAGQLLIVTSDVFALDLGFMFFVLGTLALIVTKEARRYHPNYHSDDLTVLQQMIYPRYILASLFLLSVDPFLWVSTPFAAPFDHLRFVLWTSSLAVFLVYYMKVSFFHSKRKLNSKANPKNVAMTNGKHENALVENTIGNLQNAVLTESLKVGNKQEEVVQKN